MPILKLVQGVAVKIKNEDPGLKKEENKRLLKLIDEKFSGRVEI